MQDSVECAGPQKHNGESPVFIHCMILEIQLFLPIRELIIVMTLACMQQLAVTVTVEYTSYTNQEHVL